MRNFIRIVIISGFFLVFAINLYGQELKVGVYDWKPWQMQEEEEIKGILIDIISEIQKREELDIEFLFYPFKRMTVMFEKERIDIETACSPMWRDAQKSISVYSIPLCETGDVVIMRKENAIKATSVNDFTGLKVGVNLGYFYPEGFSDAFEKGTLIRDDTSNPIANIKKLAKKHINASILNYMEAWFYIREAKLEPTDFAVAYEFSKVQLSMRFHKNKASIVPRFNKVIQTMTEDGTISNIIKKYE